ncbi:hypothetical protein BH10BDE1_BH10BDE1_09800 [soil metagenome]
MSALSSLDRKLLLGALEAGHSFERSMSETDHSHFVEALRACAAADSALVRRLSELAEKSSRNLGPKHLMALLVPIERLAGRSARDEEFLFHEKDGPTPTTQSDDKIVLCENIRSAFNVGAVYRTTETFGGSNVWLAGYTPDPLKTAMGTDALVKTERFERSRDAVTKAKSRGYSIVALENSPGAVALENFKWPEKTLLILGNERFGVDSETLGACDHVVRISTTGQKNSLNVGIAFGIAAASWCQSQSLHEPTFETRREKLEPIGFLRGGFANSQVAPRQGAYKPSSNPDAASNSATIVLDSRFEGRPSNFSQALQDLDGFERAWIVFGFHESHGWNPQVRPPRGDGTKRGVFATRSPQRPNRIGLSCVRIQSVDPSKLQVVIGEHDLLEATPIYDIKPYIPLADAFANAKAGWVDDVELSAFSIDETTNAKGQIDWLEQNGESRLRGFFDQQLRYQPFDSDRKRVELEGSGDQVTLGAHHTIAFRTWRIDFKVDAPQSLEILAIRSGYTESELGDTRDEYDDKELHRTYVKILSRPR